MDRGVTPNIAAALEVVGRMSEQGLRLSLDSYGAQATATTAPLAICLAALKACGVEVDDL